MLVRFNANILALVCCSLASPAMAADKLIFNNTNNSYISLNTGYAKAKDSCAYTYTAGASCTENGQVSRIAYGYNFTPTWGMEISYGEFGKAKETGIMATPAGVPGSGMIPYDWRWTAVGWEIAATGSIPLGNSISLIGKLGFLRANVGQELQVSASNGELWHAVMHEDSNSASAAVGAAIRFQQ